MPNQITGQEVFQHLGLVRDSPIAGTPSEFAHSVVIPFATYSPWVEDSAFMDAWHKIKHATLVDVYRCYELWRLTEQATGDGAILEVGVWRGGTGSLIGMAKNAFNIAGELYLADTFSGVVKASHYDTNYRGGEHGDVNVADVEELLSECKVSARIIRGIFPDENRGAIKDRLKLIHIDVDTYQSAKDVFDWGWPLLTPGGVVVFDDFGFSTCDGVTRFVETLYGRRDTLIVHNLNGHALAIKIA